MQLSPVMAKQEERRSVILVLGMVLRDGRHHPIRVPSIYQIRLGSSVCACCNENPYLEILTSLHMQRHAIPALDPRGSSSVVLADLLQF